MHSTRSRGASTLGILTVAALALSGAALSGAAAVTAGGTPSASAQPPPASLRAVATAAQAPNPAAPENPTNPLAGHRWGVYKGSADPAWDPYVRASGTTKKKLATIALTPKAKFFGAWIPDGQIGKKVREYIANATGGDRSVLVQMTFFRMVPWEGEACKRLPTAAEQASYKRYMDIVAKNIGRTHTAVVLQPDGPFLKCIPHGSKIPARLLTYAARVLSAKPNTSVYIEMGSADWFRDDPRDAIRMLLSAGVAHTRGFALNSSHFDSVGRQIVFGKRIVSGLARRGVPDRHFVIDTSDNGRPFTGAWWHDRHPGLPLSYAAPCSRTGQTHCVALGVPPTTDVASTRWGLTAKQRTMAAAHVDGYLWISRPWLVRQSGSFSLDRALKEIRYSPYG